MKHAPLIIAFVGSLVILTSPTGLNAQDWITAPSYYSHHPVTGQRVDQYRPIPPVYHTPDFQRSVYRQTRSVIQVGDSADYYHQVDRYGGPVRPYGEWRFPFRPFSVPYHLWGPPPGYGGYPYYGGAGGGIYGPFGPGGVVNGAGFPPPWNDGSYPDVRRTQLPPQPFPNPTNTFNNTITGNDNTINNN